MEPLEAFALVAVLAAPIAWLVNRELSRLGDARYLRAHGVVIVAERILEHSDPIGTYMGRPIWGSVCFMGMTYHFDRVIEVKRREHINARELYLEPGLVYVTD